MKKYHLNIQVTLTIISIIIISFWLFTIVGFLQGLFICINVLTFVFYGYDKMQSLRGGYRVPEAVLHTLAFLGGTPAAAIGQMLFRHKTRKRQFQLVFFSIMVFQAAVLTLYVLTKES